MNLKQTLAPTLISFAMCSNMLCNRMDLSAGAVVMLSAMFGAKMVYLYGIGLIPFALIVVGAGIVLGTISGVYVTESSGNCYSTWCLHGI